MSSIALSQSVSEHDIHSQGNTNHGGAGSSNPENKGIEEHGVRGALPKVIKRKDNEKVTEQTPSAKKQSYYLFDLFFWILELIGLALILAYLIGSPSYESGSPSTSYPNYPNRPPSYPTYPPYSPQLGYRGIYADRETYAIISYVGFALLGLGVLGSLIRLFFSDTSRYLRNILKDKSASEYLNSLNKVEPKITMIITCYHYDQVSDKRRRKETTRKEVKDFNFDSFDCLTGEVEGVEGMRFAKLSLKEKIYFADEYTLQCFNEEENDFIEKHRFTDHYFSYFRTFGTPDFKSNILVFSDPKSVPFYCSFLCFFLSHLVLMQYPYILLLRFVSCEYSLKYKKVVQKKRV